MRVMRWLAGACVVLAIATPAAAAVRYTPTSGPVGTLVTFTGSLPAASGVAISRDPVLYLETRHAGGVLSLVAHPSAFQIDPHGSVRATFVVPRDGRYLNGVPDTRVHAAIPGSYVVSFPCHACPVGTFQITKGGKLPFSGAPTLAFAVLALAALALGSGFVTLSPVGAPVRWRGTPRGRHAKGASPRRPLG